jgi:recombination protein RecT
MADTQLQIVRKALASPGMIQEVSKALPDHVKPAQFLRVATTLVGNNPDLLKCERNSLFAAVMSAASLGLMPESFLGQCYIVPFKGKATLQIGYKGMIALARRSGDISSVESGVTYENDEVELILGDESRFTIKPCLDGDPGKAKFVWCVITLSDGGKQREIMTVAQVEKIRQGAPSKNSPAWTQHWEGMARKVCIKRALKYAPLSTDVMMATAVDDAPERGVVATIDGDDVVYGTVEEKAPRKRNEPAKRKGRLATLADGDDDDVKDITPEPEKEESENPEPRGPLGDNGETAVV